MSIKQKYILPEKTIIARTAKFVHFPTWVRFETTRTAYYNDGDIDVDMTKEYDNEFYKNDPVIIFVVPDMEWPRIKVNLSQLLLCYTGTKHPMYWDGKSWQYEYSIIIGD